MRTLKRSLDDSDKTEFHSSGHYASAEFSTLNPSAKRSTHFNDNASMANRLRLPWPSFFSSLLNPKAQVEQLEADPPLNHPADLDIPVLNSSFTALNVGHCIERWMNEHVSDMKESTVMANPTAEGRPCDINNRSYCCFGMAHAIKVRLTCNMQDLQSKLNVIEEQSNLLCQRVDFVNGLAFLVDREGMRFGQINDETAKHMSLLYEAVSVDFKILADVQELHRCITRATRQYDAVIKVDINVYGAQEAGNKVGQILSRGKIYLQDPLYDKDGIEYDNPHMLTFDDIDLQENASLIAPPEPANGKPISAEEAIMEVSKAETNGWSLEGMQRDARVNSPMLLHQEQALQFMVQREEDSIPLEFRLWKHDYEKDVPGYRHAVSGCWTKEEPIELLGGILADDMGMGKTLSTLSLVARRLAAAQDWAGKKVCYDNTIEKAVVRSRATLVVVSSVLIMNGWFKEIASHLDGSLQVVAYHGKGRRKRVQNLSNIDMVFTTYHTLAAERETDRSFLRPIKWFRIVLDEAHTIRRQSTTLFKAVSELECCHRWCLSGTPIQNTLADLGSLITFLQLHPLDKASMFRKHIIAPFSENLEEATTRLQTLLNSICLRRKIQRLHLLPMNDSVRYVNFTDKERAHYNKTLELMVHAMSHGLRERYSNTPFGKFHIQLQLRLLCNHGTFQKEFRLGHEDIRTQKEDALTSMGVDAELECSYCNQYTSTLRTNCTTDQQTYLGGRVACDECRIKTTEPQPEPVNELNGKDQDFIPGKELIQQFANNPKPMHLADSKSFDDSGYSSKANALVKDVTDNLLSTKSIIFSCWTRSLDLVSLHLQRVNVDFARIDGSTEMGERQKILDTFAHNSEVRVLLMTTGTGAYGLNLAVANRVFILEPQWNPSIESQAIARVQRFLQTQAVKVLRYVVQGTVEEDIRRQQVGKTDLAERGFKA